MYAAYNQRPGLVPKDRDKYQAVKLSLKRIKYLIFKRFTHESYYFLTYSQSECCNDFISRRVFGDIPKNNNTHLAMSFNCEFYLISPPYFVLNETFLIATTLLFCMVSIACITTP